MFRAFFAEGDGVGDVINVVRFLLEVSNVLASFAWSVRFSFPFLVAQTRIRHVSQGISIHND